MKFEIINYNPDDKEQLFAIAKLHALILPASNVPRLGRYFMTSFYYKILPQKKLLYCFLAKSEGKYVGFLATTQRSKSFISEGLKGNLLQLMWVLGVSIFANPFRLIALLSQMKHPIDPILEKHELQKTGCELLSIGVMTKYRGLDSEEGKKISNALVERALDFYYNLGFKYANGQILRNNHAALKFYEVYFPKYTESTVSDKGMIMEIEIAKALGK